MDKQEFLEKCEKDEDFGKFAIAGATWLKMGWMTVKNKELMYSGEFAFKAHSQWGIPVDLLEWFLNECFKKEMKRV